MWIRLGVLCLMNLLACGYSDDASDAGFDLFFETNLDEMNDVPISFEYPIPHWIKGTLVSIVFYNSQEKR